MAFVSQSYEYGHASEQGCYEETFLTRKKNVTQQFHLVLGI